MRKTRESDLAACINGSMWHLTATAISVKIKLASDAPSMQLSFWATSMDPDHNSLFLNMHTERHGFGRSMTGIYSVALE